MVSDRARKSAGFAQIAARLAFEFSFLKLIIFNLQFDKGELLRVSSLSAVIFMASNGILKCVRHAPLSIT